MLMCSAQEAVREAMRQGPSAPVALPSGSSVPVRSLVRPPRRGRKVVLLGDTCNSRAILSAFLHTYSYTPKQVSGVFLI